MAYSLSGFNGQRPDPVSGHSHLGNGYRAYTPVLGRFTAPDSMSPFGAGGINPYAYCAGDPVNRADPSGHFSLGQGLGMALGLVGGFVLGVLTEGMALPVVASLLANMAGDAAIGALSELTTEAVDGQQINGGKVGMAALVNAGFSLAGFGLGRLSKLKGTSNRPFGGLMMEGEGTAVAGNVVHPAPSLEALPPEVFNRIASHLDGASQQSVALTSRRMHELILGYEDSLLATGKHPLMKPWICPAGLPQGKNMLEKMAVAYSSDTSPLLFGMSQDIADALRWMQGTVMGKTGYRARIILNHGLSNPPIVFHPRRLFYSNFYSPGNTIPSPYRERDIVYATYLNTNMPDITDAPDCGHMFRPHSGADARQ
jgi:RHS repeat-associated protein